MLTMDVYQNYDYHLIIDLIYIRASGEMALIVSFTKAGAIVTPIIYGVKHFQMFFPVYFKW